MVKQNKKVAPEQITTVTVFNKAFRRLGSLEELVFDAEYLLEWRAKWDALSNADTDRRLALQQELNRLAFTKHEEVMCVFFSFCRGGEWAADDHTWHCRVCGECNDWREWQ